MDVSQFNKFRFWLDSHELSTRAKLLYFFLLIFLNLARWKQPVKIATSELLRLTGIKGRRQFYEARNELVNAGLIECSTNPGPRISEYFLLEISTTCAYEEHLNGDRCTYEEHVRKQDVPIRNTTCAYEEHLNGDRCTYEEHLEQSLPIYNKKDIKNKTYIDPQGEKIAYAESVYLTAEEYTKLADKVGFEGAQACIEKLNIHKNANGRKYESDYYAILNWVVDWYKKSRPKNDIYSMAEELDKKRGEESGDNGTSAIDPVWGI